MKTKLLKTHARYAECLEDALGELDAKKVLREESYDCWSGFVDVDVLLNDGRVFSYYYSYGSCSGCDEWEDRQLEDAQIIEEMKRDATYFSNTDEYAVYMRKRLEK